MKWIARRLALSLLTLVLTSLLVFAATVVLPGDVAQAILGRDATPAALARIRTELHLDQPVHQRYLLWVTDFVHGDLGTSLARGRPVRDLIQGRLRNTVLLATAAGLLGIPLSLLLGTLAGVYYDRWQDHLISGLALLSMSLPEFVIAPVLIYAFAFTWPLFPAVTLVPPGAPLSKMLPNIVLPGLTLALVMSGYLVRMVRTAVIDAMQSEHVEMALLRGVAPTRVLFRHALPGALLPTLSAIVLTVAWLLGGVVVVENVFNYPGMGRLLVSAVGDRDVPVVLALGQLGALTYVGTQVLNDLLAFMLDPRLRDSRGAL
jgi:peptide/nickel transport system permease protein